MVLLHVYLKATSLTSYDLLPRPAQAAFSLSLSIMVGDIHFAAKVTTVAC